MKQRRCLGLSLYLLWGCCKCSERPKHLRCFTFPPWLVPFLFISHKMKSKGELLLKVINIICVFQKSRTVDVNLLGLRKPLSLIRIPALLPNLLILDQMSQDTRWKPFQLQRLMSPLTSLMLRWYAAGSLYWRKEIIATKGSSGY